MYLIRSKGFSLIEVLVSLLLISFILLGLDAMQIYSLKQARISYYFSIASHQINNMTERLITLQRHADLAEQIALWNRENSAVLPNSQGTISGTFPHYIITLNWGDGSHHCEINRVGEAGCLIETL
ncbi:MAG: prepilin-type N-terminal cleavage/methylation domain-containing protein [Gammaproteobacteria bacterium]